MTTNKALSTAYSNFDELEESISVLEKIKDEVRSPNSNTVGDLLKAEVEEDFYIALWHHKFFDFSGDLGEFKEQLKSRDPKNYQKDLEKGDLEIINAPYIDCYGSFWEGGVNQVGFYDVIDALNVLRSINNQYKLNCTDRFEDDLIEDILVKDLTMDAIVEILNKYPT